MRSLFFLMIASLLVSFGCGTIRSRPISVAGLVHFTDTTREQLTDALKRVLLNDSFTIRTISEESGQIVATMERAEKGNPFPRDYFKPGIIYDVIITVGREKEGKVEVRMNLLRVQRLQLGGERGRELVEDSYYQGTVTKVSRELSKMGWKGTAN